MTTRRENRARTEGALPDRVAAPASTEEAATVGAELAAPCPRFADSTAVRARVDPHGTFANPYLHRVLGQVGAAR